MYSCTVKGEGRGGDGVSGVGGGGGGVRSGERDFSLSQYVHPDCRT
jgi:hypothetical protein